MDFHGDAIEKINKSLLETFAFNSYLDAEFAKKTNVLINVIASHSENHVIEIKKLNDLALDIIKKLP